MRESRTYGSVRGALSNERPYRDSGGHAGCVEWSMKLSRRLRDIAGSPCVAAGGCNDLGERTQA
jgi:hypothetical protein